METEINETHSDHDRHESVTTPSVCQPKRQTTMEEAKADQIEQEWLSHCPSHWSQAPLKTRITFHFASRGSIIDRLLGVEDGPKWLAKMVVWTPNIPGLMRRGFRCSSENKVDRSAVHLRNKVDMEVIARPGPAWMHTRVYYLRDTKQNPEWDAILLVYGRSESAIVNFDPGRITKPTITRVTATGWQGDPVYLADLKKPSRNFNVLFGDMPMEGWWPWPKKPSPKSSWPF